MSMVSVPTGQGPIDAVLETPDGTGPWPGVVVVHDALGIGRDIRDITARVAAHGYLTLTPDLYTRGGRTRCVVGTFRDLIRRRGRAVDDLLSARDLLVARPDCTGRVGVIGFCMGGGFALVLAPEGFDAAAPFYGPLPRDIEEALGGSCPIVGSYGARDPMLRGAGHKLDSALTRLGVEHDVQTYPGVGHSFANRLATGRYTGQLLRVTGMGYDDATSQDAWRRVFGFFGSHLSGGAEG
ncbi:dienelactone hydrolase family protein [Rhodococcus hoagii]|uniref:dienelactone hydrolase family protein n=1 Tax=Prescottella TaxID=2979332 RepID=UPI0019E9183E|nr:dienelactone hydrolase family protein [Prescottella equi]MBM4482768.1 dienelactone hydrolase family protein [Prescottella equi]NKR65746.1 dienelactone hydrolase family protein [Prescottella equi]NKR77662.1 dienelactone hydrolase family protein [Prescottella equi]NKT00341.1 dienelactone hydrolase family protein [Prescottella equi]NKZ66199.1 dienelactone hydrolase family protein [Prescottella equi]